MYVFMFTVIYYQSRINLIYHVSAIGCCKKVRGDVKKNADLGGTRNCKLPLFVQGLFLESLDNTAKIFEK